MDTKVRTAIVLGVAGLGFALGRWTAPVAEAMAGPVGSTRPAQGITHTTVSPDSACEERLSMTERLIEAVQTAAVGEPIPFPDDLPEPYAPANFEAEIAAILAACPDVEVELAFTECSEYPCMAVFHQPTGTNNQGAEALQQCAAWKERFDMGGQGNSWFMGEEGRVEYSYVVPRVEFRSDDDMNKRGEIRTAEIRQRLIDEVGGAEPTPLEQAEADLQFWESFGHSQELVDEARAEVERLRAAVEG